MALQDLGVPVHAGPWEVVQPATERTMLLVVADADEQTWARLRDPLQTSGRLLTFTSCPPADSDDWVIRCTPASVVSALERACAVPLGDRNIDLIRGRLGSQALTPVECALLHRLCRSPGRPVLRDTLYRDVWGFRPGVRTRALDTAVRRLRAKLDACGLSDAIQTVRGVGYTVRATPPPKQVPPPAPAPTGPPGPRNTVALVGREGDEEIVRQLLAESAVVTLTGAGGVGKTSLARQIERDGGWTWVDCAGTRSEAEVRREISAALGVAPERLLTAIRLRRETRLILDNLDHIATPAAPLIAACAATPGVTVLTTSRETLRIEAEVVHRLQPLAVPTADVRGSDLRAVPAVNMLLQVARAAGHRHVLLDELEAAAEIARAVDGLPLALQIVGSRASVSTLRHMCTQLTRGVTDLPNPRRDAPSRHASLSAALLWTTRHLHPDAVRALSQVAVSPIALPFDALCSLVDVPGERADDLVATLVHTSVLQRRDDGWLHVLSPVREWLQEKHPCAPAGPLTRYLRWFAGAYPEASLHDPGSARLNTVVQRQLPMLTAALAVSTGEPVRTAAHVVGVVLNRLGRNAEALELLDRVLASTKPGPGWAALQSVRAHAIGPVLGAAEACRNFRELEPDVCALGTAVDRVMFYTAGVYALHQRDAEGQLRAARRAVEASEGTRPSVRARALAALATAHMRHARFDEAIDCISRSLELSADDPAPHALALNVRGAVLLEAGRLELAERALRQAIDALDQLEDHALGAICRSNLAGACFRAGRVDEAMTLVLEEMTLHRRLGNEDKLQMARGYLGLCLAADGRVHDAIPELSAGIRAASKRGDTEILASLRRARADAFRRVGDLDLAEADERQHRRAGEVTAGSGV